MFLKGISSRKHWDQSQSSGTPESIVANTQNDAGRAESRAQRCQARGKEEVLRTQCLCDSRMLWASAGKLC